MLWLGVMFGVCLLLFLSLFKATEPRVTIEKIPELYYTDPSYPINGFNLTFGLMDALTFGSFEPNDQGIFHILGTVCEAYKYNEKRGLVNISGTLNVQGMNTRSEVPLTYYSAMLLLQTLLNSHNETTRAQIQPPFPAQMGAFLGGVSNDLFFTVAPYFEGFRVPSIVYTALTDKSLVSPFSSVYFEPIEPSVFSINPSTSPELFNALQSFMTQMNWSLAGILFESSTFGALGVQYLESSPIKNVTFVCPEFAKIQPGKETVIYPSVKNFQTCLSHHETVRVIVLWMSYSNGVSAIQTFKELGYTGYTFIITYKQATTTTAEAGDFKNTFKYNFFIGAEVEYPPQEEIQMCFEDVITKSIQNEEKFALLLADFFRAQKKCEVYDVNQTLEVCVDGDIEERKNCVCTILDIYTTINQTFRYPFAADSVSTVAQGIYLMENNCSYLDMENPEYVARYGRFCDKTSFNLRDLAKAISAVDFFGYTGPISLFKTTIARKTAIFNFYQFDENADVVKVGTSQGKDSQVAINFTAIQFANNKIPISGN